MKLDLISTSKIVKMFTNEDIEKSGLWELTGANGHQGWAMTQKTKKILAKMGFTPTNREGDETKRCTLWNPSVVEVMKTMMQEELSKEQDEEDVGVGCSKEDIIIGLLGKIIENQKLLLEKWI